MVPDHDWRRGYDVGTMPSKKPAKPKTPATKPKASKAGPRRTKADKPRTIRRGDTGGRGSVLPEVRDVLIALLATGVSVEAACGEVGISDATFYRWMQKGEDAEALWAEGYDLGDAEEAYRSFRRDALRAGRRLEIDAVRALRKKLPEADTRELLDILQRVNRRSWSKHEKVDVHHSGTVTVNVVQRYGETVAELLRAVLADLGLSPEQRDRAPGIVREHLQRLTQKEPT